MRRICYIALIVVSAHTGCGPDPNRQPNIIVVLVDDMRWDEFSAAGHNYIRTPNIDRLANEGALFRNAFCSTPLCSPSRASFLTGMQARHHGIIDNTARNEQSHALRTFPRVLDSAGYETAFIGKWHMGNDDSPRAGFDRWVSMQGQGEATDPTLNVDGKRVETKGYVTDLLTDYALEFIGKERKRPFLLYLAHKALHPNIVQRNDGSTADIGEGGFIAAERHKEMYADQVFAKRPSYAVVPSDKPALLRKIGDLPPLGAETVTPEQTIRERSEMLMAVDESLGAMMKALEKSGELDNTVIVFTSDHGFWYGEHGLNDERRLAYEEGIRIPMLMRYPPTIKAGMRTEKMVQSIDLAPTMLEMAEVDATPGIDGRSLLPLFRGDSANWRDAVQIEYFSDTVFPRILTMGYKAIRTERYKYIRYVDLEGMDELYDLVADPYEMNNLKDHPSAAGALEELSRQLDALLIRD